MGSKLEDLLMRLGRPGQLQLLGSLFLLFSFMHTIAMNYCISFITMTPPHHCKLPETWEWPNNMSIPQYNTSSGTIIFEECRIYKDPLNQSLGFEDCPNGESEFIYLDGKRDSVITEWELVRDRKYLVRIFQTCYFVGILLGGFCCGFVADRFGRKVTWITCTAVEGVLGIAMAFISSFEVSCFLLLLRGIFVQSENTSGYTLLMEMFPLKYRTKAGILTLSIPALSLAFSNLLAYCISNWRYQLLGHSLAPVVSVIGFRYVQESIRWMLSQQRIEQALCTAQQVAKFNRIFMPKSLEADLNAIADEIQSSRNSDRTQTLLDLLKQPYLRWICLIIFFNIFLAQLSLYGFNFLINDIGGNVYVNFTIVACFDFVMRGSAYFTVEKIGRTMTSAIAMLTVGTMNLIFTLAKTYQDNYASLAMLSLTVSIIGRIFNGQFFCAAVMQASEIFPTTVRSSAIGLLSASGRLGLLLLPVILLLGDYVWKQMPFLVFGIGGIVGGLLSFFIPETRGISIPNTVEEACRLRNRKLRNNQNGATIEEMNVETSMLKDDLTTPPIQLTVTA